MEYTLRRAEPRDKERIEALFIEMLRSIYHKDIYDGYEEGYLDGFFNSSDKCIYVAEINGTVEGYISIEIHREDKGFVYLDDFSVSEEYRGKGIGTALIKKAEHFAKENRIYTVVLHVESANNGAFKLYNKLGYCVSEEQDDRYRMIKLF